MECRKTYLRYSVRRYNELSLKKTESVLLADNLKQHSVKYIFRLSMSHHTLSDLTPKSTLTSPSDHHSVAVDQVVSRERTPKRVKAAAETNPTKQRHIYTVLVYTNKNQNGIKTVS